MLINAAREYKENPEKGWVYIGFLVKKHDTGEIQIWYYEPLQVARVDEMEVIFSEGDTFSLALIEDAIRGDE